jgi:hypothetical protein
MLELRKKDVAELVFANTAGVGIENVPFQYCRCGRMAGAMAATSGSWMAWGRGHAVYILRARHE